MSVCVFVGPNPKCSVWLMSFFHSPSAEIYETLSQTSRFLKYNSKDKTWEEVCTAVVACVFVLVG